MCLVFCSDYIIPYIGSVLLFYFAKSAKKLGFSGVRSLSYTEKGSDTIGAKKEGWACFACMETAIMIEKCQARRLLVWR